MIPVLLPDLPPPDTNLEKRFVLNGLELADEAMLVTPFGQVMVVGLDLDGWSGATDSTGSDVPRVYSDGAVPSDNPRAAPRVLTLSMTLVAESPAAMRWMWDELNTRATRTDFLFVHDEWGLRRTVTARRQGAPQESRTEAAVVKGWSCQLRCADPRKYGDQITRSIGLPFTSGGLLFPLTFPATSDVSGSTGVISIDLTEANAESPVYCKVFGLVRNPRITHIGGYGPETIAVAQTVIDGNWLDIDADLHQVYENGTADRGQLVTQRGWFAAQPGVVNTFAFAADVFSSSARLEVTTAPAYD